MQYLYDINKADESIVQTICLEIEAESIIEGFNLNLKNLKGIVEKIITKNAKKQVKNKKTNDINLSNVNINNNSNDNKNVKIINHDNLVNNNLNNEFNNTVITNFVSDSNFNNKNYTFNKSLLFPNDCKLITPSVLNSRNMSINTFSDEIGIPYYDLIPKDNEFSLEEYKKYFSEWKNKYITECNISEELIDEKVHILVVCFDTSNFELENVSLVDPTRNYFKYSIKMEELDENTKRDLKLFNGQIVRVDGSILDENIHITSFIGGFPHVTYKLCESSMNKFYKESAAYGIYTIYGPFFGKKEFDLTLFGRTLDNIAKDNPHIVIISGPFLPFDNEFLKSGYINLKLKDNKFKVMNFFDLFNLYLEKINDVFKVSL